MQSWAEDFKGERYAITVNGEVDVTIGYDGQLVGSGTWDGSWLNVIFSRDHFYGKAGKDPDAYFLSELNSRIRARLVNK